MPLDLLRGRENHFFTVADDGNSTPTTLLNDLVVIGSSMQLTANHGYKVLVCTAAATITAPPGVTVWSGWTVRVLNATPAATVTLKIQSSENLITGDGTSIELNPGESALIIAGGNNRDGDGSWAATVQRAGGATHNHDGQYATTGHNHPDLTAEDESLGQRIDDLIARLPPGVDLTAINNSITQLQRDLEDLKNRKPTTTDPKDLELAKSTIDGDGLITMDMLAAYARRRPAVATNLIPNPIDDSAWEVYPIEATQSITQVHEAGPGDLPGYWRIAVSDLGGRPDISLYVDFDREAIVADVEYLWRAQVRVEEGEVLQLFGGYEGKGNAEVSEAQLGEWVAVEYSLVLRQDEIDALTDATAEVYIKVFTLSDQNIFSVARPELIDVRAEAPTQVTAGEIALTDYNNRNLRSYSPNDMADMLAHALPRYAFARDKLNLQVFNDPFFWGNKPAATPTGPWTLNNGEVAYESQPPQGPYNSFWVVTRLQGNQTDPTNRLELAMQFSGGDLEPSVYQVIIFVAGNTSAVAAGRRVRLSATGVGDGTHTAETVTALDEVRNGEWKELLLRFTIELDTEEWRLALDADLITGEHLYTAGARIDKVITRITENELVSNFADLGISTQVRNWSVSDVQLMLSYYMSRFAVPVSTFGARIWRDTARWVTWRKNDPTDPFKPVGGARAHDDFRPEQGAIRPGTLTVALTESFEPGPLPNSYNRSVITTSDGLVLMSNEFDAVEMAGVDTIILDFYILFETPVNLAPPDGYFYITHGPIGVKPTVHSIGAPTSFAPPPGGIVPYAWTHIVTPTLAIQQRPYFIRFVGKIGAGNQFRLANLTARQV